MNQNIKNFYNTIFKELKSTLEEKNIDCVLFENKEEASAYLLSKIPRGSKVGYGGSMTLEEIDFHNKIRNQEVELLDRLKHGISKDEKHLIQKQCFDSDFFITGVNAITMQGELFFIDGVGNRAAPVIYGPEKVFVVSGINKLCPDEQYAHKRMKFFTCPVNSMRLNLETPCAKTGKHIDCRNSERICSFTLKVDFSRRKNRIELILINENLGF